jgi:AraC family ethanolamine operon transcriptional activator
MLFKNLQASAALSLEGYTDFDHFHMSERYAHAESIPLSVKNFCVQRASLALPSCTLSLVRTFPRIINGYDFSGRLVIVVPMNDVSSTRLNGTPVGQSLILVKGKTSCTVLEPDGRLVAILSTRPETLDRKWLDFGDGYLLLRLPQAQLCRLQVSIRNTLEFAGTESESIGMTEMPGTVQDTLFAAFDEAMCSGELHDCGNPATLTRYKTIVDRIDQLIDFNPIDAANERLADEVGVSVRTLQVASQSVCGLAFHRYSRLKRLWAVRRQLRTGAPGLTVKASALAHGFWHISQFTYAYRQAFGELPSVTLAHCRR